MPEAFIRQRVRELFSAVVATALCATVAHARVSILTVQSTGSPCEPIGDPGELHWQCADGSGYIFDFDAYAVSLYDVSNPDDGITEGPIHMVSMGAVSGGWVDAEGRTCFYRLADAYFNDKLIYVTCSQ